MLENRLRKIWQKHGDDSQWCNVLASSRYQYYRPTWSVQELAEEHYKHRHISPKIAEAITEIEEHLGEALISDELYIRRLAKCIVNDMALQVEK